MKVIDLIARLEEEDADAEVRIVSQPGWPFECAITGVWVSDGPEKCRRCGAKEDDHVGGSRPDHQYNGDDGFQAHDDFSDDHEGVVVYLVEGRQEGYGPQQAFENYS